MVVEGTALCDEKNTVNHPSDGLFMPAHKGIAYSFGSKQFRERRNPTSGNDLHRKYSVYGVDCTGLIITLLQHQGVKMPFVDAPNFTHTFLKTINEQYENLFARDLGYLKEDKLESGDILVWPKHVGLIANNSKDGQVLINSNGTSMPKDQAAQNSNWGPKRGVNPVALKTAIYGPDWLGTGYHVLRLIETGDALDGGMVIYFDKKLGKGLICAKEDQSAGISWDANIFDGTKFIGNTVAGTSSELFTGVLNTAKIVQAIGWENNAAGLCDKLDLNGYTDWALPSLTESYYFSILQQEKGKGNFALGRYWTSTDSELASKTAAKVLYFAGAPTNNDNKFLKNRVRAIREFKL